MSFMKVPAPSNPQIAFDPSGPATIFATDCVNVSWFGGVVVLTFAEQRSVGPNQTAVNLCARIALPMPCVEQLTAQLNELSAALAAGRMPVMGNA